MEINRFEKKTHYHSDVHFLQIPWIAFSREWNRIVYCPTIDLEKWWPLKTRWYNCIKMSVKLKTARNTRLRDHLTSWFKCHGSGIARVTTLQVGAAQLATEQWGEPSSSFNDRNVKHVIHVLIESRVTSYLQAKRLNGRLNYTLRETIRGFECLIDFSNSSRVN